MKSLVLLEDIDAAFPSREAAGRSVEGSQQQHSSDVTFSGLLNVLDGVASRFVYRIPSTDYFCYYYYFYCYYYYQYYYYCCCYFYIRCAEHSLLSSQSLPANLQLIEQFWKSMLLLHNFYSVN